MDLGLEWAGFETAWQVEINPFARNVLKKHWQRVPKFTDVRECGDHRKHSLESVTVISGGYPCQDHSIAGKKRGLGTPDNPTDRSGLWFEYIRIVRELRPSWVIIENVPRLLHTEDGDRVLADLEGAGYSCTPLVLGAEILGAPHQRKRAWIVCHDKAQDPCAIEPVKPEQCELPPKCQRRMKEARERWDCGKNELRGGPQGSCSPKMPTPTATAILVKDWSSDNFLRVPNGRWRKQTTSGKVSGSMSWAQEMAARAAAQDNPRLEPTPEFCEEVMGFPAGWTDLGADGPIAARYARIVRGVCGMPNWVNRLRALGNAVVPQIPMLIGCFIREYESRAAAVGRRSHQPPGQGDPEGEAISPLT
jgi:site-specific DNA-cytosine methylase